MIDKAQNEFNAAISTSSKPNLQFLQVLRIHKTNMFSVKLNAQVLFNYNNIVYQYI